MHQIFEPSLFGVLGMEWPQKQKACSKSCLSLTRSGIETSALRQKPLSTFPPLRSPCFGVLHLFCVCSELLLQLSTIEEEQGMQLGKNEALASYNVAPDEHGILIRTSSHEGNDTAQLSSKPFKTLPHTQSMGSEASSIVSEKVCSCCCCC